MNPINRNNNNAGRSNGQGRGNGNGNRNGNGPASFPFNFQYMQQPFAIPHIFYDQYNIPQIQPMPIVPMPPYPPMHMNMSMPPQPYYPGPQPPPNMGGYFNQQFPQYYGHMGQMGNCDYHNNGKGSRFGWSSTNGWAPLTHSKNAFVGQGYGHAKNKNQGFYRRDSGRGAPGPTTSDDSGYSGGGGSPSRWSPAAAVHNRQEGSDLDIVHLARIKDCALWVQSIPCSSPLSMGSFDADSTEANCASISDVDSNFDEEPGPFALASPSSSLSASRNEVEVEVEVIDTDPAIENCPTSGGEEGSLFWLPDLSGKVSVVNAVDGEMTTWQEFLSNGVDMGEVTEADVSTYNTPIRNLTYSRAVRRCFFIGNDGVVQPPK